MLPQKIPLRAEKLDINVVEELRKRSESLAYSIENIVNKVNEDSKIIEISSQKGIGKTLAIKGSQKDLYYKNGKISVGISFDPESFARGNPTLTPILPSDYIPNKDEKTLKEFRNKEINEMMEEADVVVIDNLHYFFDSVYYNLLPFEELEKLGGVIKKEIKKDKQIILIDEDPIYIIKKIKPDLLKGSWEKLYKIHIEENKKVSEDVYEEFWVKVIKPSFYELCETYEVKTDNITEKVWKIYSDTTARSFVNLRNKCGNVITARTIVKTFENEFRKDLKKKKYADELIDFVIDNPVIDFDPEKAVDIVKRHEIETPEDVEKILSQIRRNYLSKRDYFVYETFEKLPIIAKNIQSIYEKWVEAKDKGEFESIDNCMIFLENLRELREALKVKDWRGREIEGELKELQKEESELQYIKNIFEKYEIFKVNPENAVNYLYKIKNDYTFDSKLRKGVIKISDFGRILNKEINKSSYLLEMILAMNYQSNFL